MTLSKLPNGRWRARIWREGKDVSVSAVLGGPSVSYATKREARDAYDKARGLLRENSALEGTSVRDWWERWTTQAIYQRPKQSTNISRRRKTRGFVEAYGDRPIASISRRHVAEWRESGKRDSTLPDLRAMWNDAVRAELVESNPFANLGLRKSRGNRDVEPPSEQTVWALIKAARKVSTPYFAAWLQVAAFTGMRPGELDALRWDCVDFQESRIHVAEQLSAVSGTYTLPKNGKRRYAPLTGQARDALVGIAHVSDFCFVNLSNGPWTSMARAHHWNVTRAAAGFDGTLYQATRHFAASYMLNELGLQAADVAIALGHEDGGRLIESTYGHRDKDRTLDKVVQAYQSRENVVPIIRRETA